MDCSCITDIRSSFFIMPSLYKSLFSTFKEVIAKFYDKQIQYLNEEKNTLLNLCPKNYKKIIKGLAEKEGK